MTPSQTFHDHVKELRKRLLWVILAIGISAGIAYAFHAPIIKVLQKPLGSPLFYTSPAGSFNFIVKLSMIIGMFIALPMIVYQLLAFISPALPKPLKKGRIARIIISSFLLALGGIAFGFFIMIPMSLHFFAGYSSEQIQPLISANEYLSYVMNNLILFALAFQIPLIILFINWIKPIGPRKLLRYQKHIVVGSFALALVLPFTYDPISQFIVALPIVFLYYLSALLLWMVNRKHKLPSSEPAIEKHTPALSPAPSYNFVPQPAPVLAMPATPNSIKPIVRTIRTTDGIIMRKSFKQPLVKPNSIALPKAVLSKPKTSIHIAPSSLKRGLSLDGLLPT